MIIVIISIILILIIIIMIIIRWSTPTWREQVKVKSKWLSQEVILVPGHASDEDNGVDDDYDDADDGVDDDDCLINSVNKNSFRLQCGVQSTALENSLSVNIIISVIIAIISNGHWYHHIDYCHYNDVLRFGSNLMSIWDQMQLVFLRKQNSGSD